ncbi:MAG: DUF5069 domain-containing protein [Verrucomicrobiae bacterium]|nr:DUF5069 domain-containing protein [Verrucomicrobiae bacterium]
MRHYNYQQQLFDAWETAVKAYRSGKRQSSAFFSGAQQKFIASIGATPQEFYDYAEDFVDGGEPDFTTVAQVMDIRRYYFLKVQGGRRSALTLDPATLPAKTAAIAGIPWLPRIIPKAKAKLRGELSPDIMYGCGGDRGFLRQHDIHPAEFLRVVMDHENDDDAIVAWVKARAQR